ncbi:hypothetical protein V500_08736 [Pseudogymnoascus sp. VKM F-4518 (FW-2643)]|nr:hypothetical protein V500_08736 [Pseudogymnoascus sp. VKM F-4518 (FW-2643)]
MKFSATLAALAATSVSAHTIFQEVSVDGAAHGLLFGVRAPDSNYPVQDVLSADLTCNTGLHSPVSSDVITIPAGAKVGTLWQHLIGGPQGENDPDNPIAASHHGPAQVYLAKVDDASTADGKGLSWTKVALEGLNNGVWGVDTMVSGGGWWYFTLPSCIAPGDYLMRAELIALHSAYSAGGAQFYMSCANIRVTGSGSTELSGGVSLPGAYSSGDPGITINIYGASGNPDNDNKPYVAPGPDVFTC